MYYLIHTIYGPFQRYLFTISRRQQHMVEISPLERILREPFKDDQWSSSPGEKQQKGKRFVWKQPFTAEGKFWIQCCQPCHKPQDIRGLALLTSCNQVHLPNSVHQGKVTADQFFVVILGDQTWASETFSFRKICARFPLQPEHLVW